MKLLNLLLLLNILFPAPKPNHLSADIEDRRNETRIHKYITNQWDSFILEVNIYILKGK